MFDHVKIGVTDLQLSEEFFLSALRPLGVTVVPVGSPKFGIEIVHRQTKSSLCLFETDEMPAHLHLAFSATNHQQVSDFYQNALKAGGLDNGAPGFRPEYHPRYFAAFVIGPDGHNIEVVCHGISS